MTSVTVPVTHAEKVEALRGLFARPGSPQLGAHRLVTPVGGQETSRSGGDGDPTRQSDLAAMSRTIVVPHGARVAALRGLFARPGSPRIGSYRQA